MSYGVIPSSCPALGDGSGAKGCRGAGGSRGVPTPRFEAWAALSCRSGDGGCPGGSCGSSSPARWVARWIFHELHPSAPVHRQTDDSSQLLGLAAGNSSPGC